MGRVQLLIDALNRYEELPEGLRAEVRSACGWPLDREAVLASGERVSDTWFVQGQSFEEVERLWERRVWLQGRESMRQALLLDFSHGQRRYEQGFVTGSCFKAPLAFFPGQRPLRALLADAPQALAETGHARMSFRLPLGMQPSSRWRMHWQAIRGCNVCRLAWRTAFPPCVKEPGWSAIGTIGRFRSRSLRATRGS